MFFFVAPAVRTARRNRKASCHGLRKTRRTVSESSPAGDSELTCGSAAGNVAECFGQVRKLRFIAVAARFGKNLILAGPVRRAG